jgi:hypothetical protein
MKDIGWRGAVDIMTLRSWFMTSTEMEKRLTAVERELAVIKARVLIPPTSPNHWVEKIAGTFSSQEDKAAFDEAMAYGRQWRKGQRLKAPKAKRKVAKK